MEEGQDVQLEKQGDVRLQRLLFQTKCLYFSRTMGTTEGQRRVAGRPLLLRHRTQCQGHDVSLWKAVRTALSAFFQLGLLGTRENMLMQLVLYSI